MLGWEKYLKDNGWQTYRDQAIKLVKTGICDPLDAEKVVGEIGSTMIAGNFNYKAE